jgi:hypothetical protein
MRLIVKYAGYAKAKMAAEEGGDWELHVVAHSAGSIFAAHAIDPLKELGMNWRSLQLIAPAMRIDLFRDKMSGHIDRGECPRPTLYVLSKVGELDDDVGPYGKSLLYLVSNALEGAREVPLLGMEKYLDREIDIRSMLDRDIDGLPGIVVSGADGPVGAIAKSDTHGGFDNDPNTMNSILRRILGRAPAYPFEDRDLQF